MDEELKGYLDVMDKISDGQAAILNRLSELERCIQIAKARLEALERGGGNPRSAPATDVRSQRHLQPD